MLHTLLYRAYNISSNYTNLHQEVVYLKCVWQKNSLPLFFIDNCVHKFLNSLYLKHHPLKLSSEKKDVIISLEFLGKLSLQVKKQLNDIFLSCHKNVKLTVVFKSPNRIRNAFRFKEQLPKIINSKVLYKYTCDTCNSVYIGKTKWNLLVRQYEHWGTSIFTNKALKYAEKDATAIRKHCYQHQHDSRLDNFQVLGNSVNNFHLQLKESFLILRMKPSLKVAEESVPLYLFANDY